LLPEVDGDCSQPVGGTVSSHNDDNNNNSDDDGNRSETSTRLNHHQLPRDDQTTPRTRRRRRQSSISRARARSVGVEGPLGFDFASPNISPRAEKSDSLSLPGANQGGDNDNDVFDDDGEGGGEMMMLGGGDSHDLKQGRDHSAGDENGRPVHDDDT
jgi:hypothetical protein